MLWKSQLYHNSPITNDMLPNTSRTDTYLYLFLDHPSAILNKLYMILIEVMISNNYQTHVSVLLHVQPKGIFVLFLKIPLTKPIKAI